MAVIAYTLPTSPSRPDKGQSILVATILPHVPAVITIPVTPIPNIQQLVKASSSYSTG